MGLVHSTHFYSNISIFYSNPYLYVFRSNYLMGFTIILMNFTNRFPCM